MNMVRCDQCKKEVPVVGQVSWLQVDEKSSVALFGGGIFPVDVCSYSCLKLWADEHIPLKADH